MIQLIGSNSGKLLPKDRNGRVDERKAKECTNSNKSEVVFISSFKGKGMGNKHCSLFYFIGLSGLISTLRAGLLIFFICSKIYMIK
jgi:hypothetical protein